MSVLSIKRGSGSIPVYIQVSEALRRDIQNFHKAGDALPSEADLAERFSINRHTLRRAVDELIADGLVDRQHGKGMFVLLPSIDYSIGSRTRFTENLETLGITTQSRVERKQVVPAQGGVASRLELAQGEPVIFLETLRMVDDKPFCVISHFLPLAHFPQVLHQYNGGSLHHFLEQHYDLKVRRRESLISAVLPESDDVRRLSMPKNMPVLRVKSVNVTMECQKPVEYVVTRFRGDAAQLSIQP